MKPKHDYTAAKRKRYLRYKCRCVAHRCQARQTFPRHPDDYRRPPRCWSCGGHSWRVDWYRTARLDAVVRRGIALCRCDRMVNAKGQTYPHKIGTCREPDPGRR